jgi:hypothetical protein
VESGDEAGADDADAESIGCHNYLLMIKSSASPYVLWQVAA